jgi:transcriptional regulator with XRE-family HTH domain
MKLDVGTMIVGLRTEISAQEIARRAGISKTHVHRLLNNEIRRPSLEVAQRLERVVRSLETTPRP